ncbi:MAG: hypothetical protein LBL61_01485 [Elusimicrobiota bacterium]|jgi:hypothetical protein|nr:hypothetical protein [Elusimicrobiota bacterium]
MKIEHIAVLGAGIVFAALVWHFYLGPKYDIKRGDAATMQALREADIKALREATADIGGETVALSYEIYPGEEDAASSEETAEPDTDMALAGAETIQPDEDGAPLPQDDKSRFTMLIAPVKYHLVKEAATYAAFKKSGAYPAVDFKKDMIILLESDGYLANGFFEIDSAEDGPEAITIDYKVNIIGSDERREAMAHVVLPKSGKEIILRQVK